MSSQWFCKPIFCIGFLFAYGSFGIAAEGLEHLLGEQPPPKRPTSSTLDREGESTTAVSGEQRNSNGSGNGMANAKRVPVPSEEDQKASTEKIREVFGGENTKATDPETKSRLAAQLLAHAIHEPAPADVYVLLMAGKALAIEAGDATCSMKAISLLSERFDIDAEAEKLRALKTMVAKAPPSGMRGLVQTLIDLSAINAQNQDYETSLQLSQLAATAARRSKDVQLQKTAVANLTNVGKLQKQENQLKTHIERLATNPNDSEAAEAVGRFRCFVQQHWDEGLSLLSLSSNTDLAELAKNELIASAKNQPLAKAADGWWEWGKQEKGSVKIAALRHAADLYERDLSHVTGLEKIRIQKRIQEAALHTESHEKPILLADLTEAGVVGAVFGFSKNGTYAGQPFTCGGQQWPKSIAAIPGDNTTSIVSYDLPSAVSRIQGRVGIFSPATAKAGQRPATAIVFQVASGGRVLWCSPPMADVGVSAPFRVDLRGLKSFELRTVCDGSAACAWGGWFDPQLVP